uniref:Uncharacterized protein n=1 Tax=Magallana gigas TaxID=29159 RepID=K1RJT4_MAGGI
MRKRSLKSLREALSRTLESKIKQRISFTLGCSLNLKCDTISLGCVVLRRKTSKTFHSTVLWIVFPMSLKGRLPSRLDYRMRTWWFTYLTFVALHGIFLHVAQCRKKRQRAQTPVRCEAGSHTFYHHQAGACLQCDTCTEGYSLVPEQVQCNPSSQNVVLVTSLILLTFFTLITTAFVFLRRAYRRASMRQCIEDAKKKSEDEESLQCLNNYQPKNSQPSTSPESTVLDIHVPTENEETRPKEKAHNTERSAPQNTINNEPRGRVPSLHLNSECTSVKTPKSSNSSSWNLGASDFLSATPGGAQFTIGYTNLALSRSLTCPSSDRCSVPGDEDESLEMLSQFSYVLD